MSVLAKKQAGVLSQILKLVPEICFIFARLSFVALIFYGHNILSQNTMDLKLVGTQ